LVYLTYALVRPERF
ncbi:potassium-transporting ATPase subunit F, partial [Escherichia coli]